MIRVKYNDHESGFVLNEYFHLVLMSKIFHRRRFVSIKSEKNSYYNSIKLIRTLNTT